MAFSSYRTIFKGRLGNVDIAKLKVLDRSKTSLRDRQEYINKKYREVEPFYDAYIYTKESIDNGNILTNTTVEDTTQYYKYNLNSEDSLSGDINIFKYIESDATYLLNSDEVIKEKGNRFSNRNDNISLDELHNVDSIMKNQDNYRLAPKDVIRTKDLFTNPIFRGTYNDYIDHWKENCTYNAYIEKKDRKNKSKFKKVKNKNGIKNNKITKEQFERYKALDKKKVKILKQLEETRVDLVCLKMKLINNKYSDVEKELVRKNSLRITINSIRELKKDMIYTKKSFLPRIEITPDKCPSNYDLCNQIDYKNREHIRCALLLIPSESISTDFNIIAYDIQKAIEKLIKKSELSRYEINLINTYRRNVSNMSVCSIELNKHKTQVYRDLYKIVDKIMEELNKF